MATKPSQDTADTTLHLPRILCLHGGGTNAKIFRAQCRVLVSQLKPYFRLCFADGPFLSEPGPDVTLVYSSAEYGPFRRWLRWKPSQPAIDAITTVKLIDQSLQKAMDEDNEKGATGDWVALLGFSQGAKMAASLLFMQQVRCEKLGEQNAGSNYRFAVLLAGRAPLVSLDTQLIMSPALADASQTTSDENSGSTEQRPEECQQAHVLRLPTIHVHGLRDPGLHLHRQLLDRYCNSRSARVVQWDGAHRIPIRNKDVAGIVDQMLELARLTGVFLST